MKTPPSSSFLNISQGISNFPHRLLRWSLICGCFLVMSISSEAFVQTSVNRAVSPATATSLHVAQWPKTVPAMEASSDDDENDDDTEKRLRKVLQLNNNFSDDASTTPKGIAILLNSNARGVTPRMVKAIQNQASQYEHMRVYATSTYEEAQQAVAELMADPPQLVVPIGGDGTLTTMIQLCYDSNTPLPFIGYLPMGTGNALGTVIGCNPRKRFRRRKRLQAIQDVLQQLFHIAQSMEEQQDAGDIWHEDVDIVDVPLMHVTTTAADKEGGLAVKQQVYCFFAGIGFDSLMLQDYKELQDWSSKSKFWKDKFVSVWGYTVALFTRTLPKCISHSSHLVSLEVKTKEPALWVDHRRGDVVRNIRLHNNNDDDDDEEESGGTLLYSGQAGIVAASTTPFYGGNLKLFPFARLSENGCQVRIGRIHPLMGVFNIPQIFSGAYRNSEMGCLDFIGTQFSVDIHDDGHPVQHSGESMGLAQKVELEVLKEPVRFVTLLPPRLVSE
ncbi:MAG: hypothetical protein SGBAC_011919 [Bacillariaceae sp.]